MPDTRIWVSQHREALVQTALLLECVTLGWVALEAAVSIWTAIKAHSTGLLAFGIDSVIEAASACVLLWRLNVELRRGEHFSENIERQASRISGALLFALAIYVVAIAAWSLWTGEGEEFTAIGLAITAATIPIMYVMARRKLTVAGQIGSRALRADAMESLTCGWLSTLVDVGLRRSISSALGGSILSLPSPSFGSSSKMVGQLWHPKSAAPTAIEDARDRHLADARRHREGD
jgi:divalent metal cation (Fe/Co/Zn/Cd) transporter